jgi:hypothetical protein
VIGSNVVGLMTISVLFVPMAFGSFTAHRPPPVTSTCRCWSRTADWLTAAACCARLRGLQSVQMYLIGHWRSGARTRRFHPELLDHESPEERYCLIAGSEDPIIVTSDRTMLDENTTWAHSSGRRRPDDDDLDRRRLRDWPSCDHQIMHRGESRQSLLAPTRQNAVDDVRHVPEIRVFGGHLMEPGGDLAPRDLVEAVRPRSRVHAHPI